MLKKVKEAEREFKFRFGNYREAKEFETPRHIKYLNVRTVNSLYQYIKKLEDFILLLIIIQFFFDLIVLFVFWYKFG